VSRRRREKPYGKNGGGIGIFTWLLFAVAVAMLIISGANRYKETSVVSNTNQTQVAAEKESESTAVAENTEETKKAQNETEQQTKEETTQAQTTEEQTTEATLSKDEMLKYINEHTDLYTDSLVSLANRYDEAIEMVYNYPENKDEEVKDVDISGDVKEGEIPLFLQFDNRWGRQTYGVNPMGVSGCGPTSVAMVYVGLTGDTSQNPSTIAEFAIENNYYVKGSGTSWSLMTEGAQTLGLSVKQITFKESTMIEELKEGHVMICSVKAGDFADSGHFIVITGYDEEEGGFKVHNSLRTSDSNKVWDFDTLKSQIKAMWVYSYDKE
jgi:hypothetical protein